MFYLYFWKYNAHRMNKSCSCHNSYTFALHPSRCRTVLLPRKFLCTHLHPVRLLFPSLQHNTQQKGTLKQEAFILTRSSSRNLRQPVTLHLQWRERWIASTKLAFFLCVPGAHSGNAASCFKVIFSLYWS